MGARYRGVVLLIGEMDLVALRIGDHIQQPARYEVRSHTGLIVVLQGVRRTAKLFHHPIGSPDAETGWFGTHLGQAIGSDIRIDLAMRFGGRMPEHGTGIGRIVPLAASQ